MSLRSLLQRLFESEDTTNLRERVEAMQIGCRGLQEEWTEVYNKFRTLQLRVAKQVQRLDKDSSQAEPHGAGCDVGDGQEITTLTTLSPRLRQIQQQILQRRRRSQSPTVAKDGGTKQRYYMGDNPAGNRAPPAERCLTRWPLR